MFLIVQNAVSFLISNQRLWHQNNIGSAFLVIAYVTHWVLPQPRKGWCHQVYRCAIIQYWRY